MKLIIDIPKGTYEAVKVGTINQVLEYKVWNAIKNGTPLDDVKAEMTALRYGSDTYKHAIDDVIEILDNIGKGE